MENRIEELEKAVAFLLDILDIRTQIIGVKTLTYSNTLSKIEERFLKLEKDETNK